MSTSALRNYTYSEVAGLFPESCREEAASFGANQVLSAGQVLAQITAASATEVQSLAITGTPTGGTFKLQFTGGGITTTTAAIAYNASAATVQAALRALANIGSAGVTCSGGALPGSAVTITFAGDLASQAQPLITVVQSALTGGSSPAAAVTRTTFGLKQYGFVAVDESLVSAPGIPTVSGTGSGSAFAAGTYMVQVTFVSAAGETTPSPAAPVTLTAAQKIRVAAYSSVNTGYTGTPITSANYYVNGTLAAQTAISGGNIAQTDIDVAALAIAGTPPLVNSAYQWNDGRQIAKRILRYDVATDQAGLITFGAVAQGGEKGETYRSAPTFFKGEFNTALLTGLSATGVTNLGRLISGTVSAGTLSLS